MTSVLLDQGGNMGPLTGLLGDPEITEVFVQSTGQVTVEKHGQREMSGVVVPGGDGEILRCIRFLASLAGVTLDAEHPMASFSLSDGSRIVATIPPVGLSLYLRKKRLLPWTMGDLVEQGTMTGEMAEWLQKIFATGRLGVVIVGGAYVGKTALLEALIPHIPPGNVLLVQENEEIRDVHPTLTSMLADPRSDPHGPGGLRAILEATMQKTPAPPFVVLGEATASAIGPIVRAMAAGVSGLATTCHSPGVYSRLGTYCLEDESYQGAGAKTILSILARTFPVYVRLAKTAFGRRYVAEILQVEWDDVASRLRFLPTFRGEELSTDQEISFSAGPGLAGPIGQIQQHLALLGSADTVEEID